MKHFLAQALYLRSLWKSLCILVAFYSCGCVGCKKSEPPTPEEKIKATNLPQIAVKPSSKLLLTYAKANGEFETVSKIEKIPKEDRGWVRVVDLRMKPQDRKDHELVYVADLRSKKKDGSYPYIVMSREAFEAAAINRQTQGATEPPPKAIAQGSKKAQHGNAKVILYSTSWCSVCRAARDYLKAKGIPFIEKDIEKDSSAAAELLQKARAAGISTSGVPVLDVNGTLIQGFDPEQLETLLGDTK